MTERSSSNPRGYTLTEVLVGLTIFALGMMALYRLQIASIQNNTLAKQISEGINLAQEKMEDLLAQNYDSMACSTETTGIYRIECMPALGPGPGSQTTEIHVRVSWRDTRDRSHAVTLDSIRAKTY